MRNRVHQDIFFTCPVPKDFDAEGSELISPSSPFTLAGTKLSTIPVNTEAPFGFNTDRSVLCPHLHGFRPLSR